MKRKTGYRVEVRAILIAGEHVYLDVTRPDEQDAKDIKSDVEQKFIHATADGGQACIVMQDSMLNLNQVAFLKVKIRDMSEMVEVTWMSEGPIPI